MDRIKFGNILVVCEEHQTEVTWIDDSNYYCKQCFRSQLPIINVDKYFN